jgi:hypothetical protein
LIEVMAVQKSRPVRPFIPSLHRFSIA